MCCSFKVVGVSCDQCPGVLVHAAAASLPCPQWKRPQNASTTCTKQSSMEDDLSRKSKGHFLPRIKSKEAIFFLGDVMHVTKSVNTPN